MQNGNMVFRLQQILNGLTSSLFIYNEVACRYFSLTSFNAGSQVSIKSLFNSASAGSLAKLK